ncbi:hypothetical protein ACFX2I_024310 [Malus domestica]
MATSRRQRCPLLSWLIFQIFHRSVLLPMLRSCAPSSAATASPSAALLSLSLNLSLEQDCFVCSLFLAQQPPITTSTSSSFHRDVLAQDLH